MYESVLAYRGPRCAAPSVWCLRWLSADCPGGADAPGFRGGGAAELCLKCEETRIAEEATNEQRQQVPPAH